MKVIAIIPARLESHRLPNKVLIDIIGIPMIMHVYNALQTCSHINEVYIATDSDEIKQNLEPRGCKIIMTGDCSSGTERVFVALKELGDFDIVINVQADEPLIKAHHLSQLVELLETNPEAEIATLIETIKDEYEYSDPNTVKVVQDRHNRAIYFSRKSIPFSQISGSTKHYKHIGIYAFRKDIVTSLKDLPASYLRKAENLEQLDWIFYGYSIFLQEIEGNLIGVDTKEDLERVKKRLEQDG